MSSSKLVTSEISTKYSDGLLGIKSLSTSTELSMKWWKEEMPEIVRRFKNAETTETFRVLAVGAGDGKPYDDELLNILSSLKTKVVYTVVEPREDAVEDFKTRVDSKYSNVSFEWFVTSFENYQDNEWIRSGEKFNLIHFVHALYYVSSTWESLRERLVPCYNYMLANGGAMAMILANQSAKKVVLYQTSLAPHPFGQVFNSANVIGKLADEQGWLSFVTVVDWQLDLTPCFDKSCDVGNKLLDFLIQETNFRQTADKEHVEEVMKFLESQCELMEDGSMIAYPCKMDMTMIRKEI